MPFIGSVVEPTSLSRRPLPVEITSYESEAIVNNTLASVLRQLASVSLLADEIFSELRKELRVVSVRASSVVLRLKTIEDYVGDFDAKAVIVPESSMVAFSRLTAHYTSQRPVDRALFTASSRPCSVRRAYERAASPGASVKTTRRRPSVRRRKPSLTMETSKPAVLSSLRRWTWAEAVGSVTCEPGSHAAHVATLSGGSLHTLPSPVEQCEAVAKTFPGYTIALDTSGRLFDRQSSIRRSRGPRRGRRRNTVAGGDIGPALAGIEDKARKTSSSSRRRSKSESRLAGFKDWGRAKLRSLRRPRSQERQQTPTESESVAEASDSEGVRLRTKRPSQRRSRADDPTNSSSGNWSASSVTSHTKSSSPGGVSRRQSGSSGRGVSPEGCCVHGNEGGDDDSVYSCDTEGYYTSFHVDSGLKEVLPAAAERSTTELCSQSCESQYQLFGKGSTSTTASSNNTVCTALLNPAPPPRLSSLGVVPDSHGLAESKQSHSASSHSLTGSNPSSESTLDDRHGSLDSRKRAHRTPSDARNNFLSGTTSEQPAWSGTTEPERRRVDWKSLHARRIPSMCVVTPPTSDDEPQSSLHRELAEMAARSAARTESRDPVASEGNGLGELSPDSQGFASEGNGLGELSPDSQGFASEAESLGESVDKSSKVAVAASSSRSTPVPVAEPEYATLVCRNEPLSPRLKERDTEYVSLRELKTTEPNRSGARVTLDAQGQVVYCSDSLRRTKKSFEPGQATRPANPEALGRNMGKVVVMTPVRVVRPTQRGSVSPTARKEARTVSPLLRKDNRSSSPSLERVLKDARTSSPRTVSPTARKDARTVSPLLRKEYRSDSPSVVKTSRTVSPISRRTKSPNITKQASPTRQRNSPRPSDCPGLLQTSFDEPLPTDEDEISPDETDTPTAKLGSPANGSEVPPVPANPEQLTNYLQRTNPALFRRINEPKIHRTDSYKMANVSNVANPRQIVVPTVTRAANTKRVKNPNLLGRKVYGTEIRVDPKLLPTSTERAKVLSAASPVAMAASSSTPTRERGVAFDASLSPIGRCESRHTSHLAANSNDLRAHANREGRYGGGDLAANSNDVQKQRDRVVRESPYASIVPPGANDAPYHPDPMLDAGQDRRTYASPVPSRNYVTNSLGRDGTGRVRDFTQDLAVNGARLMQQGSGCYGSNVGQGLTRSPVLMAHTQRYSPNLGQNQRRSPNLQPQSHCYVPNVNAQNQRYSPNLYAHQPRHSPIFGQNPRNSSNVGQSPRYSPNLHPQTQRYSPNVMPQTLRYSPNPRLSPSQVDPSSVPNAIYYCQTQRQPNRLSPSINPSIHRLSPSINPSIHRLSPSINPSIHRLSPNPAKSVTFAPIEITRSPLIGRDDFRLLLAKHSVDQSQKLSAAQRLKIDQSEKDLAAQRFKIDQSERISATQPDVVPSGQRFRIDQSVRGLTPQIFKIDQSEKSLATRRLVTAQSERRLRAEISHSKENIAVNGRPSFETAL